MKPAEYAYRFLGRYASAALLGGALIIGAGAAPALAQHVHDDDDDRGTVTSSGDLRRNAAVMGYREGFEHGREDRGQGLSFNYEHDEAYQEAFESHSDHFSSSTDAREIFRRAYEKGYSDGYYRRSFNQRAAEEFAYSDDYDRDGHNGDNSYNSRLNRTDVLRIATVNGYSEGYEHGVSDRASRVGFNYQHDDAYRRADVGYRSEFNLRSEYQVAFRQAFARGYQDAYYGRTMNRQYDRANLYRDYGRYGYDPYYGSPSYRTAPARLAVQAIAERGAQQGYSDGYVRGQYDRQLGVRRPNPQGHGAFQHALNGWNPQWGGSSTFQQYYRQYFMQGYEQGYYGRARSGIVFRLR